MGACCVMIGSLFALPGNRWAKSSSTRARLESPIAAGARSARWPRRTARAIADICFGTCFWTSKAQFSTTAYEQLKNRGLDLISNKALLTEISRVHEYRFELVATENEQWDWQLLGSSVYPRHVERFRKYFPDSWTPLEEEYARPVDYHALLDDPSFKNILAQIISLKGFYIATNKATALEIDALLADIDREVSELRGR